VSTIRVHLIQGFQSYSKVVLTYTKCDGLHPCTGKWNSWIIHESTAKLPP